MEIQKVALIARQRSGTGFFSTVMNSHPSVFFYPEVFLGRDHDKIYSFYRFYNSMLRKQPELIAFREKARVISGFFNYIFTQNAYDNYRKVSPELPSKELTVVGLDIKHTDFKDEPSLIQHLVASGVKVIYLVRRNILKAYISEVLNNRKKELNRKAHMYHVPPPVKVQLPVGDDLMREIKVREADIEKFRNIIRGSFQFMEIHYEDLVQCEVGQKGHFNPVELERIYNFLGLRHRPCDLHTSMKKINPIRLSDIVLNLPEVKETLRAQDLKYSLLLD